MRPGEARHSGLREAFAALATASGDGRHCLPPERLWASAGEELEQPENEETLLHLGECGACATAWRLARELHLDERGHPPVPARVEAAPPARPWSWAPLAAAAALVVGLGVALVDHWASSTPPPAYRSLESGWLDTLVPAATPLAREACVLRWTAGPEGTTYAVLVTTERLEPLARASGLAVPEYRVANDRLARVRPGERLLWRVTARLPDGRRASSRTFVTVLE